jgi:hypothetical protein
MTLLKTITATALAVACGCAAASTPTVSFGTPDFTFQAYSGNAPVGSGQVDISNTLFYIDEQTVGGLKSWYIFFDPKGVQTVDATLTFDSSVVNILDTKSALDSTNSTYGVDFNHDGVFNDYTTSKYIAPELGDGPFHDTLSWTPGSNTVTLHFNAADPGDHFRVLVAAVPEPSTYALFGIGLLGLFVARRRRT